MIVQPDVSCKELAEAEAGELIRFDPHNASTLAIVMRQTGQSAVCALLETGEKARSPFFTSVSTEAFFCVSYGKEWLLDLAHDAKTFPGNRLYAEKHGVIHIGEGTAAINLNRPPDNIQMSAGSFDLKTFKTVDVLRKSYAPVTSWKIWHTAAAKQSMHESPLYVFTMP